MNGCADSRKQVTHYKKPLYTVSGVQASSTLPWKNNNLYRMVNIIYLMHNKGAKILLLLLLLLLLSI